MLDKHIEKSCFEWIELDLERYCPKLTKGRRAFAVREIKRRINKIPQDVFGVAVLPGNYAEGDYLKGFTFKVKGNTIRVVYCIG